MERPILFSGPMVRALLAGAKTQTRRLVKPQPTGDVTGAAFTDSRLSRHGVPCKLRPHWQWVVENDGRALFRCPYGVPGDRLLVRETCWIYGRWVKNGKTKTGRAKWKFEAQRDHHVSFDDRPFGTFAKKGDPAFGWVRRHSIFMPHWACRLVLEVTGVRVERLQEISKADCTAEGMTGLDDVHAGWHQSYAALWDALNAKRAPWASNPWVWVIEFKRSEHGQS